MTAKNAKRYKILSATKPIDSLCHNVEMKWVAVVKLLIGVSLAVNALSQIFKQETWWFIQNINLVFHEAGHVLFIFFGNFLYTLGGSLLEIIVPCLVTLHFARSRQFFSAAVTSWWMATAFLSVSIYASDAKSRLLPLITGDTATHDWYNLLHDLNLLEFADVFGYIFTIFALASVALIWHLLSKDPQIIIFQNDYKK